MEPIACRKFEEKNRKKTRKMLTESNFGRVQKGGGPGGPTRTFSIVVCRESERLMPLTIRGGPECGPPFKHPATNQHRDQVGAVSGPLTGPLKWRRETPASRTEIGEVPSFNFGPRPAKCRAPKRVSDSGQTAGNAIVVTVFLLILKE